MAGSYSAAITESYKAVNCIYVGSVAADDDDLNPGPVVVTIEGLDGFSVEGTLNAYGRVAGLAKLYSRLALTPGDQVEFSVQPDGGIVITSPDVAATRTEAQKPATMQKQTVFAAKGLKHIHIEPFRPESLEHWSPETETDVYLAFGVLQEFTGYIYCCGTSAGILAKLGADYSDSAKPDAILIERATEQYVLAEWKKNSADFKLNHQPGDVDVLVCWIDNETDRTLLPGNVLALQAVARTAAKTQLGDQG